MVLLSKPEYDLLLNNRDQKPIESGAEAAVKMAEKECEDILTSDCYVEPVKSAVYQDAMQKMLTKRKQRESIISRENMKKTKTELTNSWEIKICNAVPQRYKTRARSLWSILSNNQISPINVSDAGEVEIDGSMIPSSNIIDLISYAVRDSNSGNEPMGWRKFMGLIRQSDLNVPLSALGKSVRRSLSDKGVGVMKEDKKETVKGMGEKFVWLRLKRKR